MPVKAIADAIGADTSWNTEKKLVHISYNGKDSYISCIVETAPIASNKTQNTTQKQAQTSSNTVQNSKAITYILNTNTRKIHIPSCTSVGEIYPEHRQEYSGTLDDAMAQGYSPCGRCLR